MLGRTILIAACLVASTISAPPKERLEPPAHLLPVEPPVDPPIAENNETNAKESAPQLDRPIVLPKKQPGLVRRPDHLDAVPLERDGHLNKQFRQEILFGETEKQRAKNGGDDGAGEKKDGEDDGGDGHHHEDGEKTKMTMEQKEQLLIETFHKADKNSDNYLTNAELEQWIQETTMRHLDEAIGETKRVMQLVDQNGDGHVTWDEYHYHFLVDNRLMEPGKAKQHDESHSELSPEDQEKIETEIEQWHEADMDPKDGQLSQHEFLAFRHPEHSEVMLNEMVKDILRSLDNDGDGRLTADEFVGLPKGELVDKRWEESEKEYLQQRRKEFKELIDLDGDGYVNFKELVQYTNPRNSQHAKREVRELIELADTNHDGQLSLDEVLQHKGAFFGSGLMNAARNMHDEF